MDYLTPTQRREQLLDGLWSLWEKLADLEAQATPNTAA